MTVNEIRDAREALENKILQLCEEFRVQTGFAVTDCKIQWCEVQTFSEKYSKRVTSGVSISLESI